MGDQRDETTEELRRHRQAMVDLGEALPGTGLGELGAALRDSGPWPEELRRTPMIVDTDIGGDADDALAITLAARCVPQLALVVTTDETGPAQGEGERARFARYLLDAAGRTEVPVVSGESLGETRYFCVDGLTPDDIPRQSTDVESAVRAVAAGHTEPIRWVGMGPMTNLARLVAQAPDVTPRLRVTQMGGALRYRHPERAEHNFRLDVESVHKVFTAVTESLLSPPEFVTQEVTYTPEMRIDPDHPIYRNLGAADAPSWATLLRAHLDRWFSGADRPIPGTLQHDGLTLSAALNLPYVGSEYMQLTVDEIGRTTRNPTGASVRVSTMAHYSAFLSWLQTKLDPQVLPEGPTLKHPAGCL